MAELIQFPGPRTTTAEEPAAQEKTELDLQMERNRRKREKLDEQTRLRNQRVRNEYKIPSRSPDGSGK